MLIYLLGYIASIVYWYVSLAGTEEYPLDDDDKYNHELLSILALVCVFWPVVLIYAMWADLRKEG